MKLVNPDVNNFMLVNFDQIIRSKVSVGTWAQVTQTRHWTQQLRNISSTINRYGIYQNGTR